MKLYRTVVIGCGPRAARHAKAYSQMTRGQLVACCNRGPERRDAFAQQFGIPGYADAEDMLRSEKPETRSGPRRQFTACVAPE